MARTQRGVQPGQEYDPKKRYRDLRPASERAREKLALPQGLMAIVLVTSGLMWLLPALAEWLTLMGILVVIWATARHETLPVRAPLVEHINNPDRPGKIQQGTYFFANEEGTGKEVWFEPDDVSTHALVFGTTGGGKTEALLSLAYNALLQGSGFVFIDGKGDNKTAAKIFSMLRSLGREDDFLVINYMTSGESMLGKQRARRTNKMNPFSMGTAQGLTNLVVSLMDDAGSDPMWKSRAMALIGALMWALTYLRDVRSDPIDAQRVRETLTLKRVMALASRKDIPPQAQKSLAAYLETLPGYVDGKEPEQQQYEQHGYLIMQFTKVMGMLADTYRHIFDTAYGEVDFNDIILNRRVLLVLLPSLELPPDELANVGKLIVTTMRMMMATGLGSKVEGSIREVIESKPTNSDEPYLTIFDEYGYYVVKGAAVMPAQARSLKFFMIFAGQDLSSFEKNNNQEEAASTVGNCNIKMFLKTEDPFRTSELYIKAAGHALVAEGGGFEERQGMMPGFIDQRQASIQRVEVGDWRDIKSLDAGQVRILFRDAHIRARMLFVDPETFDDMQMRLNHFLGVPMPSQDDLNQDHRVLGEIDGKLNTPTYLEAMRADVPMPVRLGLLAAALTCPPAISNPTTAATWLGLLSPSDLERALASGRFSADALAEIDVEEDDAADEGIETPADDTYGMNLFSSPDARLAKSVRDKDTLDMDRERFRHRTREIDSWESGIMEAARRGEMDAFLRKQQEMQAHASELDENDDDEDDGDDGDVPDLSGYRTTLERQIEGNTAYPQHKPDPADPQDILDIIDRLGGDTDT